MNAHSPPDVISSHNNPDVTTHNPPAVAQPSCNNPVTSQALVFEETPMLSNVLQDAGWKAVRYSPHQINSGNTSQIAFDIKQGHFKLLWIDLPQIGRHVSKDRMHSMLSQLCRWLQIASEVGVTACVFGAFGHSWSNENFQVLTQQHKFHKSYHRACHFGLKLDITQTAPSKICFVLLSKPKVESHLCNCEASQNEHKLDWKGERTSIARRPRMKIQQYIAQAAIKRLIDAHRRKENHRVHHDTPDCNYLMHKQSTETSARGTVVEPIQNSYTVRDEPASPHHVVPTSSEPIPCFPTEERLRQKERLKKMKEAGEKPRTRKVHVEDHHDDCGTDHSALAPFLDFEVSDLQQQQHEVALYQAIDALYDFECVQLSTHSYYAINVQLALNVLAPLASKIDIVEICGGSARTSTMCFRKHLKVGSNFDLVTSVDLNNPKDQQLVMQYFIDHKPLVAVMSPRCSPFGAHSNLNYKINPDGWERTYQESAPHGRFCGELALHQERNNRYFLLEQPHGSWLYEEYPWNIVCYLPSTICVTIHQCMLGQVGPSNLPAKKPTDLIANHSKLLEPFRDVWCDRSHQHDTLDSGNAKSCEKWPWAMARKVCEGIIMLKLHLETSIDPEHFAFPTRSTNTSADDEARADESWRKCPGCRGRQSKTDPRHSRVRGECMWPDVKPVVWGCPGCKQHKPYGHPSHTHSENCKHAVIAHRTGVPRTGRHPRPPDRPASASVAADLQPQLADGTDLGALDEARATGSSVTHDGRIPQEPPPEIIRLGKYRSWTVACNGNPAVVHDRSSEFAVPRHEHEDHKYRTTWARTNQRWYQLELAVNWSDMDNPNGLLPGIANPLITIFHPSPDIDLTPFLTTTSDIVPIHRDNHPRAFQPRASANKNRRTFQDADVGTEHPGDWSRFNVGRSLKALSAGNNATQIRELRKLHLRWWHGSKEAMKRVLSAAGLPKEVLDKIPQVVDTCRECRKWARPANETIPTLRMTTAFNEHVEADLMFYREHVIFHLICCGTRWHAATVVQTKQEQELLTALNRIWMSIHGPMQQLITDGESALTSDRVQAQLKRQGTLVKVRAPGQHARFIERRGAILRVTLHCLDSQLIREGINSNMEDLLAEAVFAGNSLVHVGGVTPYQCIYGRTPAMLPPLPEEVDVSGAELDELSDRTRHKIRTAALEAMIQATSLARTSRAIRSRAIAATEVVYRKGDLVDYHRPTTKDVSGWRGPVEVVEYKPEDGTVLVRLNGQPRPCRLQDVRHTLFAHVSFQVFVTMPTKEALSVVKRFTQELQPRKFVTLGLISQENGESSISQATRSHGHLLEALNHLIEYAWCFDECSSVRIGKGCKSLPAMPNATHSTLLYWNDKHMTEPHVFVAESTNMQLTEIMGDDWYNTSFVQLIHNNENPSGLCDSIDATAASHGEENHGQTVIPDAASDRLSTIPEGSNEDDQNSDNPEGVFHAFITKHFDKPAGDEEKAALHDLWMLHQDTIEQCAEQPPVEEIPMVYVSPEDPYYEHDAINNPSSPPELDPDEPHITELLVLPNISNCFGDPSHLALDEMYSIKIYNTVSKVEVIKRASDLLTKEEMVRHKPQVEAAILEELKIWNSYNCFKMVPRKGAVNIIDSRFVAKWKVKDPTKPYESRIIRMRMALRGFKEWCADALDTYAGTGSKISQRLLLSEAACHPEWSFLSLDINKAFLQGVTYDELAEATGQEERVVHFTLPSGSAQILRRIPGYENYDERYYVLKCLKPGTGCKDAPRAFSMKLAGVTRSAEVGLKPLAADPECEVKHVNGKLVLILVKHVDDLKIAGEEREVRLLLQALEKTFGKSDRNNNNFTCVGIRHSRSEDGTITLDQNEYISALKPIQHPDITGKPMDEPCTDVVMRLYWSLLGAVAYTLLTQHWVAIYIIALQRQTHKPQYQHIRKLNSLLKVLQKQKAVIVYPAMKCARKIIAFSDASFCKESESKGYGVRGTVFLRCGIRNDQECCHLVDATSQSLKLVTRSTFSSETLAAVGTADALIPLVISTIEIIRGPFSPAELRAFREGCSTEFKVILVIDAMNLFQAWTGTSLKLPSEKSLFPHIAWLRDVVKCAPTHCAWCDTRDMLADGMTKGSISRSEILNAMIGIFSFKHQIHEHRFQCIDDSAHVHAQTHTS